MNVIDTRKQERLETTFNKLSIGEVYEDVEGVIAVKVDDNKCIFLDESSWYTTSEEGMSVVYPLSTNLEILGYKII